MINENLGRVHQVGESMLNLLITYDLLSQRLERAMRPLDITMTQMSLLYRFERKPEKPWTISELVKTMGVNQPGITKAVAAMERKGWLRRETDGQDARVKPLFIKPEGLAALKEARALSFPVLMQNFGGLNEGQLQALLEGLRSLKLSVEATRADED